MSGLGRFTTSRDPQRTFAPIAMAEVNVALTGARKLAGTGPC